MIRINNVSVSFGEKMVLKNFTQEFDRGIYLLTGSSGSGKTTLTRLILGLLKADEGTVDTESTKISAVFQEDRLLPWLSALDNVKLVSSEEEATKRLSSVGLSDFTEYFPDEMSGGMKRRVAIARAMSVSADCLILDEAFNGIDEPTARKIIADILEEYKDKIVIAVTHQKELFEGIEYKEIKF